MASNVQKKVSCVFETAVIEERSTKHSHQSYKIVATEKLKKRAIASNLCVAIPSEKLDGTCCYISDYESKPWVWARLDRKPNKVTEKRFKKYQNSHRAWQCKEKGNGDEPKFEWHSKDFKTVPDTWIPASGVMVRDGEAMPDDIGHTPGWVPVECNSRQYCWHLQGVNLEHGIVLVLKNVEDDRNEMGLELCAVDMTEYVKRTMELIGTNINGNPYCIGTKEKPIHIYVPHGEILFRQEPPKAFNELEEWFEKNNDGQVEGIVWHCPDGELFKCHRHHLALKWPTENPRLLSLPVKVNIDVAVISESFPQDSLFVLLSNSNGHTFQSVAEIAY